jgi:DNA-binding transcriptional regulator YiaG
MPVDVKALREKLGMTIETFAATYRLSEANIVGWETGRLVPTYREERFLDGIRAYPMSVAIGMETLDDYKENP